MSTKCEDVTIAIGKQLTLEISERRGTPTSYTYHDGFKKISSNTQTSYNWRLHGFASKLGAAAASAEGFTGKGQELYDVTIASSGVWYGGMGFKSKDDAIRNALAFTKRNGIDVDGYEAREPE